MHYTLLISCLKAERLRMARDRTNLLILCLFALLCLLATATGIQETRQRSLQQQQFTQTTLLQLSNMQMEAAGIAPDRPLQPQGPAAHGLLGM